MAAKVLSIEICDKTVTVCRVARKGKGVRVFDSFMFLVPGNCVSDGVISSPELLAHELKMQLASHGMFETKNVYFALSSSKIAVREVKLPPMKKNLISAAIQTNAGDYFPIDLENYHITHSVLDVPTEDNPFIRVLVMAAPVSMLEGYFALAETAELNIKAIDSSGNSQYQALKSIKSPVNTVYVDVGCSSNTMTFMRDDKLLLQRTFAFGVDELITHYMKVTKKTKENYLDVLKETDVTHPEFAADKALSLSEIQSDLERLVGGITRSINYFNSTQREASTNRVVLIGLNRHLVGLRDLVAEATGLETLYLDDVPEFTDFAHGSSVASKFIDCIGTLMDPLNLMPEQFLPAHRKLLTKEKEQSITSGIILCIVIVVAAVLLTVSAWLNYQSVSDDINRAQNEVTSLMSAQQAYDNYVAIQSSQTAVNSLAALTASPNSQLVAFFKELETKMPSSILLLSVSCTSEGVSMNITVGSYEDAATVISNLREFKSLSVVEASDMSRSENEAGIQRVSFTVNCIYGTNPYSTDVNPYDAMIYPQNPDAGTATDTEAGTAATEAPSN